MSTINIRESLRQLDDDSFCKYDLLTMYDSCPLLDEDKQEIAKLLYNKEDPEVIYQKLCTYFCDDDTSEIDAFNDFVQPGTFEVIVNECVNKLKESCSDAQYNDVANQLEVIKDGELYTTGLAPIEIETGDIEIFVDGNYDSPLAFDSTEDAVNYITDVVLNKLTTTSVDSGDDVMVYTVYDIVEDDDNRLTAKCMNESTNDFQDIKLGKVNSQKVNELLNNMLNNPNYKITKETKDKIYKNSAPWGLAVQMTSAVDVDGTNGLLSTGDFSGEASFGESIETNFEKDDRVTDGSREGTVLDSDSQKVLVEWDYSETDDIEWVDKSTLELVNEINSRFLPNMEYCPACGGTHFNVKTGVCIDCGYDEGGWGNIQESLEENDEDGWGDRVEQILEPTVRKVEDLAYEVRNTVRGANTDCDTTNELADYVDEVIEDFEDASSSLRHEAKEIDESKSINEDALDDQGISKTRVDIIAKQAPNSKFYIDKNRYVLGKDLLDYFDTNEILTYSSYETSDGIRVLNSYKIINRVAEESKSINEDLVELNFPSFNELRKQYKNYTTFKDKEKNSGLIRDLCDQLENKEVSYNIYNHKKDNGMTIFYDDFELVEAQAPYKKEQSKNIVATGKEARKYLDNKVNNTSLENSNGYWKIQKDLASGGDLTIVNDVDDVPRDYKYRFSFDDVSTGTTLNMDAYNDYFNWYIVDYSSDVKLKESVSGRYVRFSYNDIKNSKPNSMLKESSGSNYNTEDGWTEEDINLHKSIDWKSRNYMDFPVTTDSFVGEAILYGEGKDKLKNVKMIKYLVSNPFYPPYYAPKENPFKEYSNVVGPMYDGRKHGSYEIHNRYETQELYDTLFESAVNNDKSKINKKLQKNESKLTNESSDSEYWYFTKHGVQPGSIPNNIYVLEIKDTPHGSYFKGNRVLTTKELQDYEIKEKSPEMKESKSIKEDLKKEFKKQLQDELYDKFIDLARTPEWGFENLAEIDNYLIPTIEVNDYKGEYDNDIEVEFRAEVNYREMEEVCNTLDKVVKKYDKNAYFEPVQPGIAVAYLKFPKKLKEDFEDDEIVTGEQEFDSAATSINSNKLPAVYSMVDFTPGQVVIDFGGGRFDNAVNYLKDKDVTLLVYDPYNRSAEHNKEVLRVIRENGGADAAINSNVLNVIKEPEARQQVLKNIKKLVKPGAPIYITVYEGSGKGNEGPTKAGYQLNRKTADYMDEIGQVFSNVKRKGKLITAINESASDKRLSSTSVKYKGYRISLLTDGSGYAIFDKHGEMEDHGFKSIKDAKDYIDEYNSIYKSALSNDESMHESFSSSGLRQANIDAIDYFMEFEDIYTFPKGKFLATDWKELRDGIVMGMDSDLEIAEGIMEYLQKEIDFNNRHKEIYQDDPQAELTLEIYNKVKKEYEKTISKMELSETLSDRIRNNELDYDEEIDAWSGEEDGIFIQLQDREKDEYQATTNSKNGLKIYDKQPKVSSKTFGRVWKDGKLIKSFEGPKYKVRSDMAKYLEQDIDTATFDESTNDTHTENDIAEHLMDLLQDDISQEVIDYYFDSTEKEFILVYNNNVVDIEKEAIKLSELLDENGYNVIDWNTNGNNVLIFKLQDSFQTQKLEEAQYGGAFDIEDDQYFTKEEIVDVAEKVCEHLDETYPDKFDVSDVYMETPTIIHVEVISKEGNWASANAKIDMRKIKKPSDIMKYDVVIGDLVYNLRQELEELYTDNSMFTESASEWRYVASKMVPDSDGFLTDYTWYENTKDGRHVFIFGDNDLYDDVDSNYADWETDSYSEARSWFDNYHGFTESICKNNSIRMENKNEISN